MNYYYTNPFHFYIEQPLLPKPLLTLEYEESAGRRIPKISLLSHLGK